MNFSDPFGLCPDSLSTAEREECEKKREEEAAAQEAEDAEFAGCAARGREQFQAGLEQMGLHIAKPLMALGSAWATGKVAGVPLPASLRIGSVPVTWGGGEGARLGGGVVPRTATRAARFMNPSYIARYAVGGTLRATGAVGAGLTFGQYLGTALVCAVNSNSYR